MEVIRILRSFRWLYIVVAMTLLAVLTTRHLQGNHGEAGIGASYMFLALSAPLSLLIAAAWWSADTLLNNELGAAISALPTPIGTLLPSAVLAVLGYLQWFVWLPRVIDPERAKGTVASATDVVTVGGRRLRPLLLFAGIAMVSVMLIAYGSSLHRRQELLPGYPASLTPEALLTRANAAIVEEAKADDGARPKFHVQTFSISDAAVFDIPVDLHVEFFNSELMTLTIYPDADADLARLSTSLANMHHVDERRIRNGVDARQFRLEQREDAKNRRYLAVTRMSVRYKLDEWVWRHS